MPGWKKALIWGVVIYLLLYAPHFVNGLLNHLGSAASVYTGKLN